MLVNKLCVKPTPQTAEYLRLLVADNWLVNQDDVQRFFVELISTRDDVEPDPFRVYSARTSSFKPWYDPNLQTSSLILTLVSPDLENRVQELAANGVASAWHNGDFTYHPHCVFVPFMPPLSETTRRSIMRLANVFGESPETLYFTGEYVITEAQDFQPEQLYNEEQDKDEANGTMHPGY